MHKYRDYQTGIQQKVQVGKCAPIIDMFCHDNVRFTSMFSCYFNELGQNFLLVDLRENFFRFRVGGTKK